MAFFLLWPGSRKLWLFFWPFFILGKRTHNSYSVSGPLHPFSREEHRHSGVQTACTSAVLAVLHCTYSQWTFLCEARGFRAGEAAHPGPAHFTLGAFNPTGLGTKQGVVAQLPPGVYAVSETHLSTRGVNDFRMGLRLSNSSFSLLHGFPAPLRAHSSVIGSYTGVGFVSTYPARVVPHAYTIRRRLCFHIPSSCGTARVATGALCHLACTGREFLGGRSLDFRRGLLRICN